MSEGKKRRKKSGFTLDMLFMPFSQAFLVLPKRIEGINQSFIMNQKLGIQESNSPFIGKQTSNPKPN